MDPNSAPKKSRFQNPLRQNYKHTKTLFDLTGIPHDYIKSVIAFSGECTFKTDMPDNVMKFRHVPEFILGHREPIIRDEQVTEIAEIIGQWFGTPSCPSCGVPMVTRSSRRDGSRFWGCPKYPQCRGTRKCA